MNFQDVCKNAMQAYIKYKTYYDKKTNASKLKQADYVYVLQRIADHQRGKTPFSDFRLIGHYILKMCCRATIIWYPKLAAISRKCFIE